MSLRVNKKGSKKKMRTTVRRQYRDLGAYLKDARIKSGLSQNDVAKKLGYTSPQFISNFERGLSSPPLKNLKTLVELYDLSQDDLVSVIFQEQERVLNENIIKLRKALR